MSDEEHQKLLAKMATKFAVQMLRPGDTYFLNPNGIEKEIAKTCVQLAREIIKQIVNES